jgi:hypothetical protein
MMFSFFSVSIHLWERIFPAIDVLSDENLLSIELYIYSIWLINISFDLLIHFA